VTRAFFFILHLPLFLTLGMRSRDKAIDLIWLATQKVCETLHINIRLKERKFEV